MIFLFSKSRVGEELSVVIHLSPQPKNMLRSFEKELRKKFFRRLREVMPSASYRVFLKAYARWGAEEKRLRLAMSEARKSLAPVWSERTSDVG